MSDEKKHGPLGDVVKVGAFLVTIGTIIFGAGAANEKLKHMEAGRQAEVENQAQRARLQDDRHEKLTSAIEALDKRVEVLTDQMKRAREARRERRREAAPAAGFDTRP